MVRKIRRENGAIMSDNHDGKKNSNVIQMPNVPPPDPKKSSKFASLWEDLKKKTEHPVIAAVTATAICFSLYTITMTSFQVNQLNEMMRDQQDAIAEIEKSLEAERLDRIEAIVKSEEKMRAAISEAKEEMRNYVWNMVSYSSPTTLQPTNVMIGAIKNYAIIDDLTGETGTGQIKATTLVAYDIYTNEEYTAEQIANQKVLLPYFDGGQEVYFYGGLSATGAWDGSCIINVYENGKLTFIKEAEYDDGKLLKAKQVFSYEFSPNQFVWAISDRTNDGDHSEGETKIYKKNEDFPQRFKMDDVAPKNIVNVSAFQASLRSNLYAYYCGSISNGYFNDESGKSYMIHLFEDGTVRLLYFGNFRNGNFNDTTGNAWYIVKNEDTDYMYYKGCFRNGNVDGNKPFTFLAPPLSLEQIQEIIGDRKINVSLHWEGLGIT